MPVVENKWVSLRELNHNLVAVMELSLLACLVYGTFKENFIIDTEMLIRQKLPAKCFINHACMNGQ